AEWVALALFDDRARTAEVPDRIAAFGPKAAETFVACTTAGGSYSGDLTELVRDARALADKLRGSVFVGSAGLATVLFTDIVSSTEKAAQLGDLRWRALLADHRRIAGEQVARYHGVIVKETGDGVLATFESPARAVRAARALCAALTGLGIQLRAGL